MEKPIEKLITRFDAGMTNVIRSDNTRYARKIAHFDILSDPSRLQPYRDFEAESFDAGLSAATIKLCKFLAAPVSTDDATILYALGQSIVTANAPKIYQKSTIGGSWVASAGTNGADVLSERVFVNYKGYLLGWRSNAAGSVSGTLDGTTSSIWSWLINGGTWDSTERNTAAINAAVYVAQGLVHSKDDILYLPHDNVITKVNGSPATAGNWTDAALTLPDNLIITSIAEWGNYLAIACRSKFPYNANSVVYLWDRDATLRTLSEKIDFGPENLELIEEIDGVMVGVMTHRNTFSEVLTIIPKVVFKYWNGGSTAKQFLELPLTSNTIQIDSVRQKINNRVLFFMGVQMNDVQIDAIWGIGRTADGAFSVYVDRLINNDMAITSMIPKGFFKFGDFVHVGFTDGGTYKVNVTDNAATFTTDCDYESVILGESYKKFKLVGVGVMTEPLPAAGSVTVGYKIDAETSFTTILTHSTDDSLYKEATNIESSGVNLPQFREIQFQIISVGNAVITGLWVQIEEIEDGLLKKLGRIISGWFG